MKSIFPILYNVCCASVVLPALMLCAVLCGCSPDFENDAEPQIVVEGWIESGQFPKVKLTYTVPITDEWQDLSELSRYVEKWARVSISDGEREVLMVGHLEDDEFPSYVYTTSEMRGEVGRTYRLKVDASDDIHAEAVTTIPKAVRIDRFEAERVGADSEEFQLYGYVNVEGKDTNDCYKVLTYVYGEEYGFRSAYMGLFNSLNLADSRRISINKGRVNLEKEFNPYFELGDIATVKLAHLSDEAYIFWRDYEDMKGLSRNPLFPVAKNLHSNIQGGLGYWFGYGVSAYTLHFGIDGFTLLSPSHSDADVLAERSE